MTNWETGIDVCVLPSAERMAGGNLCVAQGTQLGALW